MKDIRFDKILFIITEPHMVSSLEGMIKLCEKYSVDFYLFRLPYKQLKKRERIAKGPNYLKTIKKETGKIPVRYLNDSVIVYSCAEGFEFSNRNSWMPQLYNCRQVCIMHGFTRITLVPSKELFRKIINFCSSKILGIKVFGAGFGANIVDYIIVYSSLNKKFLIDNFSWKPNNVIISGKLLKYPLLTSIPGRKDNTKKCIFLLQDLVSADIISDHNSYQEILLQIIDDISPYFDEILIRKHPKMSYEDLNLLINKEKISFSNNPKIEDDLNTGINLAISFFSTALIDASLYDIPVMAIKIEQIPEIEYIRFNKVIKLDEINTELAKGITSDYIINPQYFDCSDNAEESFKKLLI